MSAAQDEFQRLLSQKEKLDTHPEDSTRRSLDSLSSLDADDKATRKDKEIYHSDDNYDDDDDDDEYHNMMLSKPSSYHVPTTVYDANTGPKGVIADAQSYERAKKRSFRRTLMSATGLDYQAHARNTSVQQTQRGRTESPEGSEDDQFMREWRETRMRELQEGGHRRTSPNKRRFGTVDVVGANGYLDAVENAQRDVVVVVCIYDPESTESSIVEDCLTTLARKHITTRFIKLHYEVAEMEHITPPALLAYRDGDVFSTLVDIHQQIPDGRGCSSASLEALLMRHRII